jgi:hypothetical protein
MVQNEIQVSVIFILIAAGIASVVALPVNPVTKEGLTRKSYHADSQGNVSPSPVTSVTQLGQDEGHSNRAHVDQGSSNKKRKRGGDDPLAGSSKPSKRQKPAETSDHFDQGSSNNPSTIRPNAPRTRASRKRVDPGSKPSETPQGQSSDHVEQGSSNPSNNPSTRGPNAPRTRASRKRVDPGSKPSKKGKQAQTDHVESVSSGPSNNRPKSVSPSPRKTGRPP